jgi:predicted RNA-binding protein (virulence factor B family)
MRIGEYNELTVSKETPHGLYLTDGEREILLPRKECEGLNVGDTVTVFVLRDSEDRPVSTRRKPLATVGEFAKMKVVSVTPDGAFLDWGLDKDLFCPKRNQHLPMREGEEHVVRVHLDEVSRRVVCNAKLNGYLTIEGVGLNVGKPVQIIVMEKNPEFMSVIIDNRVKGALFKDEWHENLRVGDRREAYIKSIRDEDKRVAVSLRPQGYRAVLGEKDRIIQTLMQSGGTLYVSDKSSPEEIHRFFGLSKGAFKKLIGALYKEGRIKISSDRIELLNAKRP